MSIASPRLTLPVRRPPCQSERGGRQEERSLRAAGARKVAAPGEFTEALRRGAVAGRLQPRLRVVVDDLDRLAREEIEHEDQFQEHGASLLLRTAYTRSGPARRAPQRPDPARPGAAISSACEVREQ